ncbi:hypothetical protein [Nocardia sp. NPDC003345]
MGGSKRIRWTVLAALCAVATLPGCANTVSGSAIAAEDAGAAAAESPELAAIAGRWVGTYTCVQGDTGLTLTIESGGRAQFRFYPVRSNMSVDTGTFEMRVSFHAGLPRFEQVAWLEPAEGYSMVDLSATGLDDHTMSGTVLAPGCTTFTVNREQT